jgi:hypothetical protein
MVGTLQLVTPGMRQINRVDFDPSSRIPKTVCSKQGFFTIPLTTGHQVRDLPLERA